MKVRLLDNASYRGVLELVERKGLHTVCQEARCPNIFECWAVEKTATFMLMGDVCTRRCGFCAVTQGTGRPLDPEEPRRVAEAVKALEVAHAVVTSVNRDELADGGASHFAATIQEIRKVAPGVTVEVLIPDFLGEEAALGAVLAARPDVLDHNTETVERLYRRVRPAALYARSLELLARASAFRDTSHPSLKVKSGLMVGLGETWAEVLETVKDIRASGTEILTVGQYLQPHERRLPVERYWTPREFGLLREEALAMGFRTVESGPLVRSSYHARRALNPAHGPGPQAAEASNARGGPGS